uniref:Uncharacterized protein n=1 Tax=Parastrongyloides trichosuri TaxID=131310 RepID=A0A0N4ZQK0_PARTI
MSKEAEGNHFSLLFTNQFYTISYTSPDLIGDSDRFSDINFSFGADGNDNPIVSEEIDLVTSEVPVLLSKDPNVNALSTIHEESKDVSNLPLSENVTLKSNVLDISLSQISNQCPSAKSDPLSIVSSLKSGRGPKSYDSKSNDGSIKSQVSLKSGNSSIISRGKSEENFKKVMSSIDNLKNISLNDDNNSFRRPISGGSCNNVNGNNRLNENRVHFNPIHQSIGSSFFNQNSTTNSRNTNNRNQNIIEEKEEDAVSINLPSIDDIKVSENEVQFSKMESFSFLNNIIEATMNILVNQHFDYLNENQVFFEMSPGYLAEYIPESVDENDKSTFKEKLFEEVNKKENKLTSKKNVEVTGNNTSFRNSRMSNRYDETCDIKSVDSAAFYAE